MSSLVSGRYTMDDILRNVRNRCKSPAFVVSAVYISFFASALHLYADDGRTPLMLRTLCFTYVCVLGAANVVIILFLGLIVSFGDRISNMNDVDRFDVLSHWLQVSLIMIFPCWTTQRRHTFQHRLQEMCGRVFCVFRYALEDAVHSLDDLYLSWKDQDIQEIVRDYCEERIARNPPTNDRREDVCLVCLHNAEEEEQPQTIFCPRCGQGYHVSCFETYISKQVQLALTESSSSSSSNISDTLSGREFTEVFESSIIKTCLRCMLTENIRSFAT